MGLAATQVRLLQLTSRQHKIEYSAQRIQAQKLQLSNESDMVYNAYMTALDAKKVQYKYVESDGSISYRDANFNNMFSKYNSGVQTQYALEILSGDDAGKFYVTSEVQSKYNNHNYNNITDAQVQTKFGVNPASLSVTEKKDYKIKIAAEQFAVEFNGGSDAGEKSYYTNLYTIIASGGNGVKVFDTTKYGDDYEWLTNMLANGDVIMHKWDEEAGNDGNGEWTEVTVATDTLLQEVSDDKELKKAEATYEAENSRINKKDAKYDTLLSQTETERNAIKTEMDSLKQVKNDNIDKTFKLFS